MINVAMPDVIFDLYESKLRSIPFIPESFGNYLKFLHDDKIIDELIKEQSIQDDTTISGTIVYAQYSFNATKIYDIVTEQNQVKELAEHDDGKNIDSLAFDEAKVLLIPTNEMKLKTRPDVQLCGTLVMVLNRQNKISRFEFHYSNTTETRSM